MRNITEFSVVVKSEKIEMTVLAVPEKTAYHQPESAEPEKVAVTWNDAPVKLTSASREMVANRLMQGVGYPDIPGTTF